MRLKWSKFVLMGIWVVGLFGLLLIGYHLELTIKQKADETFNILPLFWFYATVPFLFGIYISLLFVKGWSFKFNPPLFLCVTVPCLIISFYSPVVYTIVANTTFASSFNGPAPFWLLKINSFGIAAIVAGLTFTVGLFGIKQQIKDGLKKDR
ncbi:hypothetical protein QNH39_13260 [Neobacillus novalis]|uniref:Uncharacterized protein n=1 Tax=Neobacillus novalis TaxID=220687 RepID=A0AA95SEZ6_9BACI|nr:hypothetical protein [Neobacillus novalis]WHY88738.1 hypothetical protein QNH39_13260 [Neobacillus novalis]